MKGEGTGALPKLWIGRRANLNKRKKKNIKEIRRTDKLKVECLWFNKRKGDFKWFIIENFLREKRNFFVFLQKVDKKGLINELFLLLYSLIRFYYTFNDHILIIFAIVAYN